MSKFTYWLTLIYYRGGKSTENTLYFSWIQQNHTFFTFECSIATEVNARDSCLLIGKAGKCKKVSSSSAQLNVASKEAIMPATLKSLECFESCSHNTIFIKKIISACVKVLNWGLGPHEDQTAEMVLIWSSFYTKVLILLWRGRLLTAAGWGWLIRDTRESNTINACAILNCD